MKKYLSIALVALLALPVLPQPMQELFAPDARADIGPVASSVGMDIDGSVKDGTEEEYFRDVFNGHSAALEAGDVVVLKTATVDGATVTLHNAQSDVPICVITEACAVGAVCKRCQTYGLGSIKFSAAAGNASLEQGAYLSATLPGYVEATPTGSVQSYWTRVGYFYSAHTASSSTASIFIRLR